MHGVTPESVRRELMDAGFQVERTETGTARSWWSPPAALTPATTPERPHHSGDANHSESSNLRAFATIPEWVGTF